MNLVINSQFRPFTYDEMVKPLVQYKEAYDRLEQDYSDLVTQTEMWKDIVNQTNNPEAYEMYKGYSDRLNSIVDDFSKGMTLSNRKALIGMKRDYAKNITPIVRASEAMNAANELRIKAGPDAIFEVREYNSLDQFLHGKTANNKYQSREALTKKTAAMTEAAMAEALKDPEFKRVMGDQFWEITQHTGGSYDELMEAMKLNMMDNPIAQNKFSQIRQKVARESGIQNYDITGQQAIMDAIDTGLYVGLDKPVRNFQANQDHMTPAQRAQLALSAANSGMVMDSEGNWSYDPSKDPTAIRANAKSGGTESGGTKNNRETTFDRPVFIDIKNPNKSHVLEDDEEIKGTPSYLSDFEDYIYTSGENVLTGKINKIWDDIVKKKTNDSSLNLSTLLLKNTKRNSLEDVFDKYDIYITDDGNFFINPRNVKIYNGSTSGNGVAGYDMEKIEY